LYNIQHLSSLAAQQLSIDEVTVRNTIANFQAAFDAEELTVNGKRVDSVIEKTQWG